MAERNLSINIDADADALAKVFRDAGVEARDLVNTSEELERTLRKAADLAERGVKPGTFGGDRYDQLVGDVKRLNRELGNVEDAEEDRADAARRGARRQVRALDRVRRGWKRVTRVAKTFAKVVAIATAATTVLAAVTAAMAFKAVPVIAKLTATYVALGGAVALAGGLMAGSFLAAGAAVIAMGIQMGKRNEKVGEKITKTWERVSKRATKVFEPFGDAILAVLPHIEDNVMNLLDALKPIIPIAAEMVDVLGHKAAKAFDKFVPLLADAAEAGLEMIQPWINQFTPIMSKVHATLKKVMPTLTEVGVRISKTLVSAFMDLLDVALPFIEVIAEKGAPAFARILEALAPLVVELAEAFLPVLESMIPLAEKAADVIVKVAEAVGPWLKDRIEDLIPWVEKAVDFVGRLADAFIKGDFESEFGGFGAAIDNVVDWLQTAYNWVRDHWPGFKEKVLDVFQSIKGWIDENWPKFKDSVIGAWETIRDWEGWTTIKDAATGAFQAIKTFWDEDLSPIIEDIEEAITSLSDEWDTAWDAIKGVVETTTEAINEAAGPILLGIKEAWDENYPELKASWDEFWDEIGAVVEETTDEIATENDRSLSDVYLGWNNWGTRIQTLVTIQFDTISQIVQGAMLTIQGIVQFFGGLLTGDWESIWNGITDYFRGQWQMITAIPANGLRAVQQIIGFHGDLITFAWNKLWDWIEEKTGLSWDNILREVSGAWEDLKIATQRGVIGVARWVATLPGRIWRALGGLGKRLEKRGREIMDGLKRGIEQRWPVVKSLLGWIGRKIPLWKGPPSYDRRLLIPAGKAVIDGFVTGIKARRHAVQNVLGGVTDLVTGTNFGTPGLAMAGGAPGSRGSRHSRIELTVNFTGMDLADSRSRRRAAETIRDELELMLGERR